VVHAVLYAVVCAVCAVCVVYAVCVVCAVAFSTRAPRSRNRVAAVSRSVTSIVIANLRLLLLLLLLGAVAIGAVPIVGFGLGRSLRGNAIGGVFASCVIYMIPDHAGASDTARPM